MHLGQVNRSRVRPRREAHGRVRTHGAVHARSLVVLVFRFVHGRINDRGTRPAGHILRAGAAEECAILDDGDRAVDHDPVVRREAAQDGSGDGDGMDVLDEDDGAEDELDEALEDGEEEEELAVAGVGDPRALSVGRVFVTRYVHFPR
jgi:hypothetical protein